jgi:hypothetical protein
MFLSFGVLLLYFASAQRPAQRPTPACGPNNTVPAGYTSCRAADGSVVVAAPTGTRNPGGSVYVPPPPAGGGDTVRPTPTPNTSQPEPKPRKTSSHSTLWTVAGIGAIAGLITAIATLIKAIRNS